VFLHEPGGEIEGGEDEGEGRGVGHFWSGGMVVEGMRRGECCLIGDGE
jgi:hypothetical protein